MLKVSAFLWIAITICASLCRSNAFMRCYLNDLTEINENSTRFCREFLVLCKVSVFLFSVSHKFIGYSAIDIDTLELKLPSWRRWNSFAIFSLSLTNKDISQILPPRKLFSKQFQGVYSELITTLSTCFSRKLKKYSISKLFKFASAKKVFFFIIIIFSSRVLACDVWDGEEQIIILQICYK